MPEPLANSTLETAVANPAACTGSDAAATPSTVLSPSMDRYRLDAELARGGMGVVYRATDCVLGRDLAVKVLQESYALDSAAARRFADEARITAQLQHPAIPPIHDFGILPDGRLFLAMKLIKGQTLEELLESRPEPSAERGRFLAVFERVCQAIAYAHAHQVIHRDLKPANVMVGSFGEVQVMDWGLAKVLGGRDTGRPEPDPEATRAGTEVVSLRDSDGSFTQAGSILGTPAYMAPEQAVGAVGKVDQRSDVFGLGAVFAVILTGQPPFAAASAETRRVQAAQGDVSECFARLNGCGAEPELVALCKRCLNPRASERPANAGEVAAAVAEFRQAAEERARSAELDRVAASLRTVEERKRRRVQWALAVAVGLLLVGGLTIAWWQAELRRSARERQAQNVAALAALLDECEQALRSGDAAGAAVTLEAAEKRSEEGDVEDQTQRLTRCQGDWKVLHNLNAVDQFRWTPIEGRAPNVEAVSARYGEALRQFGADPDTVGPEVAADRVSHSAVRERLLAALDRLLQQRKSSAVRQTLQLTDPSPFRDAVRDAVRASESVALQKLAGDPEALAQPPEFAAFMGEPDMITAPERRRALLRTALEKHPSDLGLLMGLGLSFPINQRDGAEKRTRWFQAAVAVAPANPATYLQLGVALNEQGDQEGAIAAFHEAIRLDPRYAYAHHSLGKALRDRGDLDDARAEFMQAIRLEPDESAHRNGLAAVLAARGDLDAAIAEFKAAIGLDPRDAYPHTGLGAALEMQGDLDGASAAFRNAIHLAPRLPYPHEDLGDVEQLKGNLSAAIAEYEEVLRLDPKAIYGHSSLASALTDKGDFDGAIAHIQDVLRLDPQNVWALNNLPRVERMRAQAPRLPAVLAGKDKARNGAEAYAFALLCAQPSTKRYADAVRLFNKAFAKDPRMADDLAAGNRYDAATLLAHAAWGEDSSERQLLRGQALSWLRADLALLRGWAESPDAAQRRKAAARLADWLVDVNLAPVRPGPRQAPMPPAERSAWLAFWADVKATLAMARK